MVEIGHELYKKKQKKQKKKKNLHETILIETDLKKKMGITLGVSVC